LAEVGKIFLVLKAENVYSAIGCLEMDWYHLSGSNNIILRLSTKQLLAQHFPF
jgi:hypothetical protein